MSATVDDDQDEAATSPIPTARHRAEERKPLIPRFLRTFAIPVILAWVAIIAVLNTVVPQLDEVGKMRAVSMSPADALQDRHPTRRRGVRRVQHLQLGDDRAGG